MKPHQKKPLTTSLANSSGKPNMHKQSENVHTNHINVDEQFESAKEKFYNQVQLKITAVKVRMF